MPVPEAPPEPKAPPAKAPPASLPSALRPPDSASEASLRMDAGSFDRQEMPRSSRGVTFDDQTDRATAGGDVPTVESLEGYVDRLAVARAAAPRSVTTKSTVQAEKRSYKILTQGNVIDPDIDAKELLRQMLNKETPVIAEVSEAEASEAAVSEAEVSEAKVS